LQDFTQDLQQLNQYMINKGGALKTPQYNTNLNQTDLTLLSHFERFLPQGPIIKALPSINMLNQSRDSSQMCPLSQTAEAGAILLTNNLSTINSSH
jgi:hypothetical protein